MEKKSELYRHSYQEAKARGEVEKWRENYRANVACKKAIEESIREGFNGSFLRGEFAQSVIDQFGVERTAYVLANTLQVKEWDGRFSQVNREWFGKITVTPDEGHNYDFAVESHPAVVDGFMNQFRTLCQRLQLEPHQDQAPQAPGLAMQ